VTAVAVAALLAGAACAEDPSGSSASTTAEPTPLSTEPLFIDDRERPKVAAALGDFIAAFEAREWEEALSLINADGRAYLKRLREITATGGPGAIRRLDAHGRVAVAVLRTVRGAENIGEVSLSEFLQLMADEQLLGNAGQLNFEFKAHDVQPLGDKAFVRIYVSRRSGFAFEIDFALENDAWKVNVSDMTSIGSYTLEAVAEKKGIGLTRLLLLTASGMTGERLDRSVWEKPAADA
jgi:hypothetical protein